jgi:GNAT superfamily N-acetyltransferase
LAALRLDLAAEDEPGLRPREGFEAELASFVADGLGSGRWLIWAAEASGELVANVYLGLLEKVPHPKHPKRRIGYMTNVYTRPDRRGQGVGSAIVDEITKWAAANDVELITVWPSEASVDFYRRHGFAAPHDLLVWEA